MLRLPTVIIAALAVTLALPGAAAAAKGHHAPAKHETRCGWFANPTPSNVWITDRDGEWEISIQGGRQADGDWPTFSDAQWVHTNGGSYGYGCACVSGTFEHETKHVLAITRAHAKALDACRADEGLHEP